MRDHVTYAGLQHDRVLLLVQSPAWATRTRMDQAHILAAVRSLGLAASSVTAKVALIPSPKQDSADTTTPSPSTAKSIRAAANATTDPDLKALFLALAAAAEKPRPNDA